MGAMETLEGGEEWEQGWGMEGSAERGKWEQICLDPAREELSNCQERRTWALMR